MDLIVGGGTHGLRAVRFCIASGRPARVFDPDPACRVARFLAGSDRAGAEIGLTRGGMHETYRFYVSHKPEWVFPTAPVHVAALLVGAACGMTGRTGDLAACTHGVPEKFCIGQSGADAYFSVNREGTCMPECPSPDCCPVTGEDRSVPLFVQLGDWCPGAAILESVQLAPGLGAIRGSDLRAVISRFRDQSSGCVGTACRCHGIVTALAECTPCPPAKMH
ncbi:MAG: hypothetical protein LUQ31_07690 [Methanoregula sp.]|nr:hypothetical protein [Methanoregula sp.]